LKEAREFYLFMDEAEGKPYFKDLNEILERGRLKEVDRERAQVLARCLIQIHKTKYSGKNARTLYRRRIRDLIGHGECIMGIIDSFDKLEFTTDQELLDYARKCLTWWGKIRDKSERLSRVHGDYHPGNIWFHGDDFTLLDRSRGSYGEPAGDLSCLGINYIYYAIKERGTFEGPFAELFRLFLRTYFEKIPDHDFFEVTQPFFAFRVLVLANPVFYPDDTTETKRKLLNFGLSVLETKSFNMGKISAYIERA
jgi:aminoglycoside phosphotransferase (APT) family kinase protein